MAAVLAEKKSPAAKYESAVDEQIAQATSRIRGHDMAFGGLLLVAMVLVYATTMIILDRYLGLPEWVRQLALAGFLAATGTTAYLAVVRPFRRRVNPLYVAVQVEKTIDDAKNSVAGYVEAVEKGSVHPAVRAAMGARAAKSVGTADVNRAVDHRSLVYTGAVAVVLTLALIILFFVFRPAQFRSLVVRTFAPFSSDPIASRTQLAVTEPTGGDATITAGQAVTIKVQVGGKIPAVDSPQRVRVLLRHSLANPEYEDVAMEKGDTSREWQVRVPDYLVRNGFWYKVVGGDAETPEYQVSVRSLPLFTEVEVAYEYPAYTRRAVEPPTKNPHLEAYRGTKVTVTGKTNRVVKEGRLVFDPPTREPVAGTAVADRPDSVRFQFYLTASGSYKLYFTTPDGEHNEPPLYGIKLIEDLPPQVEIVKPEEDSVSIPANGQLAVDGTIGDDLGIDRARLKLRVAGPMPRPLADKPYHDGKSFRRDRDGTWPTSLEYKDSVDLAGLKDADGKTVDVKEGMTIEYWLEATDNRTRPGPNGPEPDPNTGRSKVKKVVVAPPVVAPDHQEKQAGRKQERQAEEEKHRKAQQQRLDQELRDPNQKPNPGQQNPPPEGGTQEPNPKAGPMNPAGMSDSPMAKPAETPDPKTPDQPPMPMKGMTDPMMPPGGMPMGDPEKNGMGEQAPQPGAAGSNQTRQDAARVEEELNKESQGGGSAKSGPPQEGDKTNAGEAKPPMPDGMGQSDAPKAEPKAADPADPMASKNTPQSKPGGNPETPAEPAAPKPEPGMTGQPGGAPQPAAKPEKSGGSGAGADKEAPPPQTPKGPPMPMSGDSGKPTPDQGEGPAKPATEQKNPAGSGMPPMPNPGGTDSTQPQNPAEDAAKPKPMPSANPGTDKDPGNTPAGTPPDTRQKPEGGMPKPQTTPEPSGTKPAPKNGDPMPGGGDKAGEPKPGPSDASAGNPMNGAAGSPKNKPDPKTSPNGGGTAGNAPEKGVDKPGPDQQAAGSPRPDQQGGKNPSPGASGAGERRKLDAKEKQELTDAAKNLTSKDANKRKAAQNKLDEMVGEKNRKEVEDIAKGLNSTDKKEREAAEKKVNDLKEQMTKGGGEPKGGENPAGSSQPDPKAVEKAVNDLKSADAKTRADAKEKLDKILGDGAGKQADDLTKGLQSDDPKQRAAAERKLEDLKKQADQMAKNGAGGPKKGPNETPATGGQKIDPKDVEKALNDLKNGDANQRAAAKEKLDDMLGAGAGKQAEDLMKGLQSDDPKQRAAAERKLEDLKKQADQMAKNGAGGPKKDQPGDGKKIDPKAVEKALDDLNAPDQKTREQAKAKLDETFGKGAGKKAEEMNKRMNSGNLNEESDARSERDELLKKAEEMAKSGGRPKPEGKKLSPEEIADLAKKAEDLNSADEAKRKAAEQALDNKLGEQNRKKLQEAMKNQPGTAPQTQDDTRQQVEKMAKEPTGAASHDPDGNRTPMGPTGPDTTKLNEAMKEDARNRAKSAELQLEKFEKNKNNKELLDRLGWDEGKYNEFLKQYQEMAGKLKQEADALEKADNPAPAGPAANISQGTRVESRNGATSSAGGTGAVFAAPGFADAMKKFQEGAGKLPAKK